MLLGRSDRVDVASLAHRRVVGAERAGADQDGVGLGGHFLETGFEVHRLETIQRWLIPGDRNPNAANGSSVQGGAGLPDEIDSRLEGVRAYPDRKYEYIFLGGRHDFKSGDALWLDQQGSFMAAVAAG